MPARIQCVGTKQASPQGWSNKTHTPLFELSAGQACDLVYGDSITVSSRAVLSGPQKPSILIEQVSCRTAALHRTGNWTLRMQMPSASQAVRPEEERFHKWFGCGGKEIPAAIQEERSRIHGGEILHEDGLLPPFKWEPGGSKQLNGSCLRGFRHKKVFGAV